MIRHLPNLGQFILIFNTINAMAEGIFATNGSLLLVVVFQKKFPVTLCPVMEYSVVYGHTSILYMLVIYDPNKALIALKTCPKPRAAH